MFSNEAPDITLPFMVRYVGRRQRDWVTVTREAEGESRPIFMRLDLRKRSPRNFDWGSKKAGAAHLALAILSDAIDEAKAIELHEEFKHAVIAKLPRFHWVMTRDDVLNWFNQNA